MSFWIEPLAWRPRAGRRAARRGRLEVGRTSGQRRDRDRAREQREDDREQHRTRQRTVRLLRQLNLPAPRTSESTKAPGLNTDPASAASTRDGTAARPI